MRLWFSSSSKYASVLFVLACDDIVRIWYLHALFNCHILSSEIINAHHYDADVFHVSIYQVGKKMLETSDSEQQQQKLYQNHIDLMCLCLHLMESIHRKNPINTFISIFCALDVRVHACVVERARARQRKNVSHIMCICIRWKIAQLKHLFILNTLTTHKCLIVFVDVSILLIISLNNSTIHSVITDDTDIYIYIYISTL